MSIPSIYLDPETVSDFAKAISLEWLVTNGLGGYASSTVLGINTRKYHGLLIASFNPPVDRQVLLTKIDEEILIGDVRYLLGSNEFRGIFYPEGYKHLCGFTIDPFPTFQYKTNGIFVEKKIFMPHLKNATIIMYDVCNNLSQPIEMKMLPLLNLRHFYDVTDRHKQQLNFNQKALGNGAHLLDLSNTCHLILSSTEGSLVSEENDQYWIDKIFFRVDEMRGESCFDDSFQPGHFKIRLDPADRKHFFVVAAADKDAEEVKALASTLGREDDIRKAYDHEINRRVSLLKLFKKKNPDVQPEEWLKQLVLSTDLFIVNRKSIGNKTIIAGYHWFEDWGRDALIALPGLTLVTGRFLDAREILSTFATYCRDGLLPNRFPDREGDQPVYNAVDSSLWFFSSVLQYLKYTGDFDFVQRKLWKTMESVVAWYEKGTLFGIHMDEDCLIEHGLQLTWMDAVVHGRPVTPRAGKSVEIQALWHNALRVMEMLANRYGKDDESEHYGSLAREVYEAFNRKFWNPQKECLFDVINNEQSDPSVRPNQVFAISTDFPMVDGSNAEKVVESLWKRLWVKYGLRTLSPDDPRYVGKYMGDFAYRDTAYHNGTVWPWLTGPFVTAFLKTKKFGEPWRAFAFENFLKPLFTEAPFINGLGTIGEIFDGDSPHLPQGCIAQAWSAAEPLRAYIEDVLFKRPPFEKSIGLEIETL